MEMSIGLWVIAALFGWEGNRRSVDVLAMRYILCCITLSGLSMV